MSFVNPLILFGAGGALLPLLIHLLTRDRVQKVEFSSLRFFAKASRRILRRKRLQEAILLALRMAACALLAVVLARPYLGDRSAQATLARMIVVDVSASMARPGMDQAVRDELDRALRSLSTHADAAGLIAFADTPQVLARLDRDFTGLAAKLAEARPGAGGTDIAEALRKADQELRQFRAQTKEIVLISDLQRAGWRRFAGDWRLAADVRLIAREVRPVGEAPPAAALAIADARTDQSLVVDHNPRAVGVRVANHAASDQRDVEVTLTLRDQKVGTQKINLLRAGESVPVRFRHVFDAPGDNAGVIRVGDAAAGGPGVWYFNTRVIPRLKVLILTPGAARSPLTDASFFVRLALAPGPHSPIQPLAVPVAEARPEQLREVLVVVLADVDRVPPALHQALVDHLALGRGVLHIPGHRTQAAEFNRSMADVAPCKLRDVMLSSSVDHPHGLALGEIDFEYPVFAKFSQPGSGDLSMPRFERLWQVTDSQMARVPARFDNGRPALLERTIGKGVAMLLASPADLEWNNFALRPTFAPFLHETVRYLAIRSERRTAFRVGERLPLPEGATLQDPQGRSIATEPLAAEPGHYKAQGGEAGGGFVFAVNRDPAEADPAAMPAREIVAAVEQTGAQRTAGPAPNLLAQQVKGEDRQHLWWYLAVVLAALLVAELVLGNHTTRH